MEGLILAQSRGHHPDLTNALRLLLHSGGKRIRPGMVILIGRLLRAPSNRLITMAAAIELLHTATLVHDDLIDGSLLRRGMPTLNSKWSAGATVLAGDFLFAKAAKLAADTESIEIVKLFANTLTTIVNGEITQLFSHGCNPDREEYLKRIYAKTASLFETAALSAAILSGTNEEIQISIKQFGFEIGMAFQIMDDVLDFTSDTSTIGKPVGNDIRQGIVTLPVINFIEQHPEEPVSKKINAGICPDEKDLQNLINGIQQSDSISKAVKEAEEYISRSITFISSFNNCDEKDSLVSLANYIIQRKV